MDPTEARNDIARLIPHLLTHGLAIDTNSPVVRYDADGACVTWDSAPRGPLGTHDTDFGTIAQYRKLLEDRQYHFLLFDGAFVQAMYLFHHGDLYGHSLSYYPCPVRVQLDPDPESPSPGDLLDRYIFQSLDSFDWLCYVSPTPAVPPADPLADDPTQPRPLPQPNLLMRSPLRFDYDPTRQDATHPRSHLHFSQPDCRIPVHAPVSFGQFVRFIFRSFYRAQWDRYEFLRTCPRRPQDRSITQLDELEFFIECRQTLAAQHPSPPRPSRLPH